MPPPDSVFRCRHCGAALAPVAVRRGRTYLVQGEALLARARPVCPHCQRARSFYSAPVPASPSAGTP